MTLLSLAHALRVTFRNLTRPKNTEPLPWKGTRERAERYRASFALVHDEHGEEACIGCMLCEKICPSQIISVTQGPKAPSPATGKPRGWCTDFTLDLNACIICELCVQVCPTDAIIMLRVQEQPAFAREDLLLTMDKLYANEKLAQPTWATPTKLQEMQDPKPKKPASPPPAEAASPTAAGDAGADGSAGSAPASAEAGEAVPIPVTPKKPRPNTLAGGDSEGAKLEGSPSQASSNDPEKAVSGKPSPEKTGDA